MFGNSAGENFAPDKRESTAESLSERSNTVKDESASTEGDRGFAERHQY
jgi:hypothetical protein